MMRRLLVMLLLTLPPLAAAEQDGPETIEIPDIRANIIKMLQQKGDRPDSSIVHTPDTEKPESPPAADDLFEQARKQMEYSSQEKKRAAEPTVSSPEPPSEPTEPSVSEEPSQSYVPLPSKQITIEDLDDLEELKWEIDEAKKRQREQ